MDLKKRIKNIAPKLSDWWDHKDQKYPYIIAWTQNQTDPSHDDDLESYWMDTESTMNRVLETMDSTTYFGQALPYHYIDFGASAMACALGAKVEYVDKETIWAHPCFDSIDQIMNIELNTDSFFYKKIIDLTTQSAASSNNHHFVAPFALGAPGDTLANLYGTENLLIDMISQPEKVHLAMDHLKNIWIESFQEIQKIIKSANNEGGIGWAGIWAPGTTFPLQEDFSYMISPEMFDTFCLPRIIDLAAVLDYPFYHLDGIGAIAHLDSILSVETIKAVQWQPGAGHERLSEWYWLLQKIIDHGKSVQVYAQPSEIDDLIKNVGPKGLVIICPNISHDEMNLLSEKYYHFF